MQTAEHTPGTKTRSHRREPAVAPAPRGATRRRPLSVATGRVILDAATISLALAAAYFLRFSFGLLNLSDESVPAWQPHMMASAVWIIGLLVAMAANRLYDEDTLTPGNGELARLFRSHVSGVALIGVLVFLTKTLSISRGWFALVVVLSFGLLALERLAMRRFMDAQRRRGNLRRAAIFVSATGRGWPSWIEQEQHEFDVVGHLALDDLFRYQGRVASAEGHGTPEPDRREAPVLLVDAHDLGEEDVWRLAVQAGRSNSPLFIRSPVRMVSRSRLITRVLDGRTIVKVSPAVLTGGRAFQKRAFDLSVTFLAAVFLSPLLLALALAVLATSGRPILFGQERVGKNGRIFRMWKFRTMKPDAERESGPVWTVENDSRRTRLGTFLRKLSLDELPQLFNVLAGDMSLVGPRPERPVFVESFSREFGWYEHRHRIRPGITGWAQANGMRGNTDLTPRIEFDNWYIENWTLFLDLKILLSTFREVVNGRNAY